MEIECETEAKKEAVAKTLRRPREHLFPDSSGLTDNGPSGITGLSVNTGRDMTLQSGEGYAL